MLSRRRRASMLEGEHAYPTEKHATPRQLTSGSGVISTVAYAYSSITAIEFHTFPPAIPFLVPFSTSMPV